MIKPSSWWQKEAAERRAAATPWDKGEKGALPPRGRVCLASQDIGVDNASLG